MSIPNSKTNPIPAESTKEQTQFQKLISVSTDVQVWRTPNGQTFAEVDGHNVQLTSKQFKSFVSGLYYSKFGFEQAIGRDPLNQAIEALGATATATDIVVTEPTTKEPTQFDKMMELLKSEIKVWRNRDDQEQAFATITTNDHFENVDLTSTSFKRYAQKMYFSKFSSAIGREAMTSVIDTLVAGADQVEDVFRRVGRVGDTVYIDLGTDDWSVVEVNRTGWKITHNPPVRFQRTSNTGSLPQPIKGGSLELLRPLAATSDEGRTLLKGWLLQCYMGHGPYLVGIINGEQNSAKSSVCRLLKRFVDPLKLANLTSLPRDVKSAAVDCRSEHAIAYDNVSYLPGWLSDVLCIIATGGGIKERTLYTNGEQFVIPVSAPILLNGIPDICENAALISRSMIISQPSVEKMIAEKQLKIELELIEGQVFGGLLDLIAVGLRDYDLIPQQQWGRMADAEQWITACLGTTELFEEFHSNQTTANELALDASPIAGLIKKVLRGTKGDIPGTWQGTAEQLRLDVTAIAGDTSNNKFPKTATAMGNRLRRDAPLLRKQGIDVSYPPRSTGIRTILIKTISA